MLSGVLSIYSEHASQHQHADFAPTTETRLMDSGAALSMRVTQQSGYVPQALKLPAMNAICIKQCTKLVKQMPDTKQTTKLRYTGASQAR